MTESRCALHNSNHDTQHNDSAYGPFNTTIRLMDHSTQQFGLWTLQHNDSPYGPFNTTLQLMDHSTQRFSLWTIQHNDSAYGPFNTTIRLMDPSLDVFFLNVINSGCQWRQGRFLSMQLSVMFSLSIVYWLVAVIRIHSCITRHVAKRAPVSGSLAGAVIVTN